MQLVVEFRSLEMYLVKCTELQCFLTSCFRKKMNALKMSIKVILQSTAEFIFAHVGCLFLFLALEIQRKRSCSV